MIRTAAFVGPLQSTVDCELAAGTPVLSEFVNGPLHRGDRRDDLHDPLGGHRQRPEPGVPGRLDPPAVPQFVSRDFGFGATKGTVKIGNYTFPASALAWSNEAITVTVPDGALMATIPLATGQLTVARANGRSTLTGVTVTVGSARRDGVARRPDPDAQDDPGGGRTRRAMATSSSSTRARTTRTSSSTKGCGSQGAGAWSTVVNAIHYPGDALQAWREKLAQLAAPTCILPADGKPCLGLLEGQTDVTPLFRDQEGPGFLVIPASGRFAAGTARARIDGFTIRGADIGGGIFVNAYADRLQILNNRLANNLGSLGGGIRLGNPQVARERRRRAAGRRPEPEPGRPITSTTSSRTAASRPAAGSRSTPARNATGSPTTTSAATSRASAAAASATSASEPRRHRAERRALQRGLQQGTVAVRRRHRYRRQAGPRRGGLTPGAGNVSIQRNLIQGNLGGAGDGGGIALRFVNGQDVAMNRTNSRVWYRADVTGNTIVNNVTGLGGGGISLQDTVRASITRNTIANNDSAAVAIDAFAAGPTAPTTPQVAGIVSRPHSGLLAEASGQSSSIPAALSLDIVWHSRSFYWDAAATPNLQPDPAGPYRDLSPGSSAPRASSARAGTRSSSSRT